MISVWTTIAPTLSILPIFFVPIWIFNFNLCFFFKACWVFNLLCFNFIYDFFHANIISCRNVYTKKWEKKLVEICFFKPPCWRNWPGFPDSVAWGFYRVLPALSTAIYLSIYLSVYPSMYFSVHLSLRPPLIYLYAVYAVIIYICFCEYSHW